ncbi:hypothetical protein DL89DRAFT_269098 [Linderina pennispora]|uniref:MoaB/Mog domain-containing protein n=1 Tax=Linderina pennispora TaxID=61395 RepID=A0A1Y1W2Y4_9FUNG|nr:uncharacterized protein DL89DRAFT_269098 [Linderina pennispora]ORX67920.1 hypothetical protein DL89DRAFT_269098 [Linderina pennispora]
MAAIPFGILTVSDSCAQGLATDTSGPALAALLEAHNGLYTKAHAHAECRLVVITGGTGMAATDVTIKAVQPLFDKELPAMAMAMALSQVAAGIIKETLILALPGSKKAHAIETAMAKAGTRHLHTAKGTPKHPGSPHHHDKKRDIVTHDKPENTTRMVACGCGRRDAEAPSGVTNDLQGGVTKRARHSPYPMIPVDEALNHVLEHVPQPRPASVHLAAIRDGMTVSKDVVAAEDVPGYPASIMDGYAVVASDGPGVYTVRGAATAGSQLGKLMPGEIMRIATGAPVPDGADAVVMVEDTRLLETTDDGSEELKVEILESGRVQTGQHIRPVGYDTQKGSVVTRAGTRITTAGGEIGALAASGNTAFEFMSTGDEVVDTLQANAGMQLARGQIRDSNRPALLAALRAVGPDKLAKSIKAALETCDGIITTGGVSMGERDWLKPVVEQKLNGKIIFGRVMMKPSKPTTFVALPEGKFMFALPGNPASALVAFHMFAAPAIRKLAGHVVNASVDDNVAHFVGDSLALDRGRPEFMRGRLVWQKGSSKWTVEAADRHQQSSRMASMQGANALIALPIGTADKPTVSNNELVDVIVIGDVLFI